MFSTYLGGTGTTITEQFGEFWEQSTIATVVIDGDGNVIVSGDTNTTDIPATVVHDHRAGLPGPTGRDIYVAKLNASGTQLLWLALIGGGDTDDRASLALGADGFIYLAGRTRSTLSTTPGAFQPSRGGTEDAFVARLAADGSSVTHLTYLGGSGLDTANALVVDSAGRAYVVGTTEAGGGADFPTTPGVVQSARAGTAADAFVARIAFGAGGATSLNWATFFGGAGVERGLGIGLTPSGAVIVTGFTASADLPIANANQPTLRGAGDFFVARLTNTAQTLVFSTYLGGSQDEGAASVSPFQTETPVAVVNEEELVIGGLTNSNDFPTANAAQGTLTPSSAPCPAAIDAFVTRMRWNGTALSLVFSTYVGGAGADTAYDLDVDPQGNAVVAGATQNATCSAQDAFVAKFSATGDLAWSATYGGSDFDVALGLALDALGDLYITGQTRSADLSVFSLNGSGPPYDATLGGTRDAFVARITEVGVPAITSVTPTVVPTSGGTTITIRGTDFIRGATVTVRGVPATSVTVVNSGLITAVVPPGAVGTAPVVVTNPSGLLGTLATGFSYGADTDGDGLPDDWEQLWGFNTGSGAGNDGPNGNPDNDGATNLKEFTDGTNPTVAELRYFAEGATLSPLTTRFALLNTDDLRTATVVLQFLMGGSQQGQVITRSLSIAPQTRATVVPGVDYAPDLANAEFSTVVRSNLPVVADRMMTWNGAPFGVGSHAETAILAPAEEWFLAEGATIGGFELYYLIQNPNDTDISVDVTYLLPSGALAPRSYPVKANSRANIYVNGESGLEDVELSAILRSPSGKPIIVERAMYLSTPQGLFTAGHESAGITQQAKTWFFAEGATGAFFDLFILVANPNPTPANVTVTFLSTKGETCAKPYAVTAGSRFNIWVDAESIPGCPIDFADTALSTSLVSVLNIVAERAMWWPANPDASAWYEAHNSPGATASGTLWAMAEGEVGNADQSETYVLVANTSNRAGLARVTLYFEDGTSATRDYELQPNSRTNVPVGVPTDLGGFGLAVKDRRFGLTVESLVATGETTAAQIVVERALYSTPAGAGFWAAGTNALATRLR